MSTHPAILVHCDASHCDRVLTTTGDHAASYEAARAYARTWGWTSPPRMRLVPRPRHPIRRQRIPLATRAR